MTKVIQKTLWLFFAVIIPVTCGTCTLQPGSVLSEPLGKALVQFNRGAALLEQYKYSNAAKAFEKVLNYAPDWNAARFNLGLAYLNMLEDPDIDGYKKTPRQQLLSYFARLLSYTLNDERERFDGTLKGFEEYAKDHRDSPIRKGLPFDFNDYKKYIPDKYYSSVEDAQRKIGELERVWDQIP